MFLSLPASASWFLPTSELDGGRFWTMDEIKSNLGKGVFTPNFEGEVEKVIK